MTETIDHYSVLGVSRSAGQPEIAPAYRRLVRAHHPDVSGAADAGDRMRAINTAYDVLSDPPQRAAYAAARSGVAAPRPYVSRSPAPAVQPVWRPAPSGGITRLVGLGFLLVLVAFAVVTCVLSSQLPTTRGPDGVPILSRATATALALAALSPAQRAALESPPKPANPNVPGAVRDHPVLRSFRAAHACGASNSCAVQHTCAGTVARLGYHV